uniref:Testis expressed 9 n=1 Tax=Hucho hucho TaxID=62062 RepID=A0A4W5PWP4_9TELE
MGFEKVRNQGNAIEIYISITQVMTKKRVTSNSNSQNRPPGNQQKHSMNVILVTNIHTKIYWKHWKIVKDNGLMSVQRCGSSVPYVCYDFFNFLFELYFDYLIFYVRTTKASAVDDVAVLEDCVDFSLAKTIRNIEGKLDDGDTHDNLMEDIMPSVRDEMGSDAQICFLKAKLCVMQEEFNRLSYECNKKDDANSSLSTNIKEVEEDRARLQKTTNIQQTHIEKHRALAEESNRKGDGLQQQVTSLQKEIEGLKRAQKQAATNHSAIEVRLNRALEEVERSQTQLTKLKQMSKDTADQEHKKIET